MVFRVSKHSSGESQDAALPTTIPSSVLNSSICSGSIRKIPKTLEQEWSLQKKIYHKISQRKIRKLNSSDIKLNRDGTGDESLMTR